MATRNPSLNNLTAESFSRSASPGILSPAFDSNDAELHGPRGAWWWTGKHPQDTPGFSQGCLRALPMPSLQVKYPMSPRPRYYDTEEFPKPPNSARAPRLFFQSFLIASSLVVQNFTRQQVLDYFDNTWTMTEILFASLQVGQVFLDYNAADLFRNSTSLHQM